MKLPRFLYVITSKTDTYTEKIVSCQLQAKNFIASRNALYIGIPCDFMPTTQPIHVNSNVRTLGTLAQNKYLCSRYFI